MQMSHFYQIQSISEKNSCLVNAPLSNLVFLVKPIGLALPPFFCCIAIKTLPACVPVSSLSQLLYFFLACLEQVRSAQHSLRKSLRLYRRIYVYTQRMESSENTRHYSTSQVNQFETEEAKIRNKLYGQIFCKIEVKNKSTNFSSAQSGKLLKMETFTSEG